VDTTLAQALRMSAPRAIALCQCFNGALEFQAGNWEQAEKALRESIALYRSIGAASGEALACQRLGVLQTAQGRLEAGRETLEEGAVVAERAVMRAHCLTRMYAAMARNRLEAGDVAAADDALASGLQMSERHGHCATCEALLLPVAVSVRLAQQDTAAAETFCRQLEQAAEEYASTTWLAMAEQARGEVAAASGDLAAALTCYRAAYEQFSAANYAYEAARCLDSLAELYQHRDHDGDPAKAQAARSEARQIFQQLGAVNEK
jgi:predicted negative regulator of RcsB-dependent stress response